MSCAKCNKKLMITMNCQCLKTFCIKHRIPEDHDCTFDFKQLRKTAIPVIGDKHPNKI